LQAEAFVIRQAGGQFVDGQYERIGFLKHAQLSMVSTHAVRQSKTIAASGSCETPDDRLHPPKACDGSATAARMD
jgi:hypothetical protein